MAFTPRYAPDLSSISWVMHWLDGDEKKVEMVDTTPDGGISINSFITYHFLSGRPVKPDHMPTKLYPTVKRKHFPDYFTGAGRGTVVSDKFRTIVEALEPDTHQFFPVQIVSKNQKTHYADMFIMIICNRLDTVHAEKTNWYLHNDAMWVRRSRNRQDPNRAEWEGKDRLVLSSEKIGSHHLWIDKYMDPMDGLLISNVLKEALEAADLLDVEFYEVEEG